MTEKTKCQCCGNSFEIDSDQAICVESFGECIFCRFSPNSKGSKSGTQEELSEIVVKQEVKRRFKNQQPKTIDMVKFIGSGAPVMMSDEHRAMIQRGVDRTTPPFKPDYNTEAVLVEEMQRMAKRIEELEALLRQPEQETVAWPVEEQPDGSVIPVDPSEMTAEQLQRYTTPPKRPWVGLTEEDIEDCMEMSIQKTCRAIEAKLKEKNT